MCVRFVRQARPWLPRRQTVRCPVRPAGGRRGDHVDRLSDMIPNELDQFAQSHAPSPSHLAVTRWEVDLDMGRTSASFFDKMRPPSARGYRDQGALDRDEHSSAGDRLTWPPQTSSRARLHDLRISSTARPTFASTSMVSAVPAGGGDGARRSFRIRRRCAATIGTTIIDVRLPGIPPMLCLSTTICAVPFQPRPGLGHGGRTATEARRSS